MTSEAIVTIAATTVAFTELVKWYGVGNERAPFVVLVNSALGVLLWIYAHGDVRRDLAFDYFTAWITVSLAAAGVYGFTRTRKGSQPRRTDRAPAAD